MIRDGIPTDEVEPYLHARAWLKDAAWLLRRSPESLATELITTMLRAGSITSRDGKLHATAEHTPVPPSSLRQPPPATWPAVEPARLP
ncbi:hypothetical protein [Amycolatopsis sp. NPDC051372]|uniref:hypothetical protein n=1 Tax=unclassified Amycolatopsis TaxID=2618356 RepID=UPI00342E98D2